MKPNRISRRDFVKRSGTAGLLMMGMKQLTFAKAVEQTGLKDAFKDRFLMGTAISPRSFEMEGYQALVKREFNAITAVNDFKWERIQPEEGKFEFGWPDQFVEFGQAKGMCCVGHVLVWHSQCPDWVFMNGDKPASKALVAKRMENHIGSVVERYKGKLQVWDVVNEAVDFSNNGPSANGWRKSKWLETMGPEFVDRSFHLAHEADPKAELLYNDYEMQNPGRRDFVVNMIKDFKKRGVPIHGVGMQGHVHLGRPSIEAIDAAITAYATEGMKVHITELDVDVLPMDNKLWGADIATRMEYRNQLDPYTEGLPAEIEQRLTQRWVDLFELFIKHQDSIERVTTWGSHDAESWKNWFPIPRRTNYPLLFDREMKPKRAVEAIKKLVE